MKPDEDRLERLFEAALASNKRAADIGDTADLEPEAVAFLDEVFARPERRERVVEMLTEAVVQASDIEFFEYCFYHLRWPELQAFIWQLGDTWGRDPRKMNALSDLLQSFDDDWGTRDFFKGYVRKDQL